MCPILAIVGLTTGFFVLEMLYSRSVGGPVAPKEEHGDGGEEGEP